MTLLPDQETIFRFPDQETLGHVTLFPDQETIFRFPDQETTMLKWQCFLIRKHVTRKGVWIPDRELYRTVIGMGFLLQLSLICWSTLVF